MHMRRMYIIPIILSEETKRIGKPILSKIDCIINLSFPIVNSFFAI